MILWTATQLSSLALLSNKGGKQLANAWVLDCA